MANNSIKTGTNVAWFHWYKRGVKRCLKAQEGGYPEVFVGSGKVVAQSQRSDEHVIVEWDTEDFLVSVEHVDDLIEI